MIYKETKIQIADNSGARKVRCFQLARYSKKKSSRSGQVILGSVIKYKFNRKVVKKQLCQVLLTTSKKSIRRKSGLFLKFDVTQGILVTKDGKLVGTRVFGPISNTGNLQNIKLSSVVTVIL